MTLRIVAIGCMRAYAQMTDTCQLALVGDPKEGRRAK